MSVQEILRRLEASPVAIEGVEGLESGPQLLARVARWQDVLREVNAKRVAVRADNSPEWVALDLALLAEGILSVPVPDFFSAAQTEHVIESAGIDCWIDRSGVPEPFEVHNSVANHVIALREVFSQPLVPNGCAKITFTSGSTGAPKGVCLSAEHMMATATSLCDALKDVSVTRHACVLPFALLLENVAGI